MDIINVKREERILFNKGKVKYMQDNIDAVKISNSSLILFLLKKYAGSR